MTRGVDTDASLAAALRRRLATGFAWNLVGAVFNQGSTLAANVLLARVLGLERFGEFALTQSTLVAFSAVFQLSLGFTTTRYIAELHRESPDRTGRFLGLCMVVAITTAITSLLVLFLSARWLADAALHSPQLRWPLLLAAGAVGLNVINAFQTGILAGLERYKDIARAGAVAGASYILLCPLASVAWGLNGAVIGVGASALVQSAVLAGCVRRGLADWSISPSLDGAASELPILARFAIPATLSGFSTMPALWYANALLVREGGGVGEMALFSAANNFRMLVVALPALLNGVGLTVLSAQIVAGRAGGYRGLFWTILIATAGLAAGGSLIVLVAGGILLGAFGDAFRSAYPILVPLCAAAVLESLAIAVAQLVQTEGRMWKILFGVALPRDVGLVVITKAVVAPLGARGLALAHLCSCVVAAVGVTCLALLARRRVNAW